MHLYDIKEFLDEKANYYNQPKFIESDPIQIPHLFTNAKDIEISGFIAAIFSWGMRKTIINKAKEYIQLMDYAPHNFIVNATDNDLKIFKTFKHRTFNYVDAAYLIRSLQNIYKKHGGLRKLFETNYLQSKNLKESIKQFRKIFFELNPVTRTTKHISDVSKNAAAKRINMFLRWMVRNDNRGVDFGIWKGIPPSALYIPLDIHTGNVARKIGLLSRNQNDWKAVEEITKELRKLNSEDPVVYDFALFGLGVFESF